MTSVPTGLAGLVAATLVAAAGLVGLAPPASAAMCSTSGISAVADGNDGAGGGISTACDRTTSSRRAAAVFQAAGFTVRRDTQGAVCQVNGRPSKPNCGKLGTEYWSLWWSDGKGGWAYSQEGDTSLTVPRNGSVAWVWQGPSGRRQPGVAPARVRTSSPKPTPKPVPKPAQKPTQKPTPRPKPTSAAATKAPGQSGVAAPSRENRARPVRPARTAEAATPTAPGRSASATPSAGTSSSPSSTTSTSAPPGDDVSEAASVQQADGAFTPGDEPSGLPLWVPAALILALAAAGTAAVWWRNRREA